MVTVKEIKKTGNEIEADYYSERDPEKFHMKINYVTGDVLEDTGPQCSMSPSHVRRELVELAELEDIPEESTVLWY